MAKKVYIDVRKSFSITESGKFNGGNNYAKRIIWELIRLEESHDEFEIHIICLPEVLTDVCNIFNIKSNEIHGIRNLCMIELKEDDIYFCPHVDDSWHFEREIREFKKANPKCRIYLTIHDRRHLENRYEKYDSILKKGAKTLPIVLYVGRKIRGIVIDRALKGIMSLNP